MNDDLDGTVMDWALAERLGGERPPDLTAAVRARLAGGASASGGARRWLAAAVVLLATLAVVAVAVTRLTDGEPPRSAAPQDPTAPPIGRVGSRAQLEALPADTRHVIGTGITADELPALLRLRGLEVLELTAPLPSPIGPGSEPRPLHPLSDDGLRLLASMKRLRVLRLQNQIELGAAGFAALPHLPALSELSLTWSNADDAALAVLSRLRLERLELQACPRIGRVTIERIARMDSLRVLALGANPHLEADWLGALADLEHLESLDLGMIGSRAFFSGLAPLPQSEPGTGVTDDLLAALTKLPALRALNLDYAGISAEGLMALRALPTLERLSLRGSFAFLDDGESELLLRSFPKLRTVVTDAGERTLR